MLTHDTGRHWTSARSASAADPDRYVGLQKLFEALTDYARDHSAPRGSTKNLRHRVRDAIEAGAIPHVRVGNRLAVRQGDIPLIAETLGLRASD